MYAAQIISFFDVRILITEYTFYSSTTYILNNFKRAYNNKLTNFSAFNREEL